ncbi:MAG TPA: hypothetical protein PKA64_04260 [Myxococcota bacterium]|nr:hypothetical protein [Myxococcota bacterium]
MRRLAVLAVALASPSALAADVQFDGFYQARARLFDTLSLDRSIVENEGLSWYVQHRLWLRPKFILSDQVAMFAEVRGLDNVAWGDSPVYDPLSVPGGPWPVDLISDDLQAGTVTVDGVRKPAALQLWRAWGEVHTKIGTFKFGRMPLQWGLGVWQNDGLKANMDHGDSADRISFETMVQQVWLRAAADINTEGLVNKTDDTTSLNVAAAYRTERMEGGLQFQYRRRGQQGGKFDLFTLDGAFDLGFGPVGLSGEVVGQFGRGTLPDSIGDVSVTSVGAVIDAGVGLDKLQIELEGGLATGDKDPTDSKITTFTFDRDYNVGFILFEQAMPSLASRTSTGDEGARSLSSALTADAVSNALYLRPRVAYQAVKGLWIEGTFLTARTAKVPELYRAPERRTYGHEIDLGVRYEGIEHFVLDAKFGTFIPGTFFRNFQDDTFQGFKAPVFGGQLTARVEL